MSTHDATPSSPAALDPSGRKAHILGVARRLWSRHGYRGTPLRRIADEAGVALALIDHHFGAKHHLFARALEPIAAACERATALLPPPDAPNSADTGRAALRSLIEPARLLAADELGRHALRLWVMHRHEPLPEVNLPLKRATDPLLAPATRHLQACWPAAPRAMLTPGSTIIFGMAAELCLGEQGSADTPAEPAGEPPSFDADRLVTVLAAGLELSRVRSRQGLAA